MPTEQMPLRKQPDTASVQPVFGEKWRNVRRSQRQARACLQTDLFAGWELTVAGKQRTNTGAFAEVLKSGANSQKLTREERKVAELIQAHRRSRPIPLKRLVETAGLNERAVKLIVEELIVRHSMKIGASRELPHAGYYLCVDGSRYRSRCASSAQHRGIVAAENQCAHARMNQS